MPQVNRRFAAFTALGLVLTVSACSSDDDPTEDASAGATETTEPLQISAEPTPGGTQLAFGEPATVPHLVEGGTSDGTIGVAVESIEAGTPEEREELNLEEGETGDIHYVTFRITNVNAPEQAPYYYEPELSAMQADGQPATPLMVMFDEFEPCDSELRDALAVGDSYTTCTVYLAATGVPVSSVQYTSGLVSAPIVWS